MRITRRTLSSPYVPGNILLHICTSHSSQRDSSSGSHRSLYNHVLLCNKIRSRFNSSIRKNATTAFFPSPAYLSIITNIVWQLNNGLHGVIFLVFNRQIREEVLGLLGCSEKRSIRSVAVIPT
ncbi:hypothetical protein Q1695_006549 [Nippostrongylus brasiliensis]|nr:hypothetical protein Q1695_006549 [Nippostrongylus brasiliensis]